MSNETTGGLETPERRAESTHSGRGFECKNCGFGGGDREAFDVDGLAMACPECASTRVEHRFSGGA